jgi:hypothetical protein
MDLRQQKLDEIQAYRTRAANPLYWVNAFENMHSLLPNIWPFESSLSLPSMDAWWYARNHPWMTCVFIDLLLITELRGQASSNDMPTIQSYGTKENSRLYALCGSVADRLQTHRAVFIITKALGDDSHENHYFVVIFDYDNYRAHIMGNEMRGRNDFHIEHGSSTEWDRKWRGPWLWEVIGRQLGWIAPEACLSYDSVRLIYSYWQQVCDTIKTLMSDAETFLLTAPTIHYRMVLTVHQMPSS